MKNILFILLSLFVLVSCDDSSGSLEPSNSENGLDVNKAVEITPGDTAIRGVIGSKIQLDFKEINISAGSNTYTWSSTNTNIANVNQNGIVTSFAFGTTSIKLISNSDSSISDEVILNVIDTETFYAVDKSENTTTVTAIGGTFDASFPNPAPNAVFNSTNVLKFERGSNAFSFLRFTSTKKINFGNPDNTITFWLYAIDAGNNGLVPTNNQIRVIARNAAGTGAQQAATPVQEIVGFNQWQEYTFDMTDVLIAGTDYFQVNIFVAPASSNNNSLGTIYYIDNVRGPFLN
jgi:hypothetical protein